MSSSLPMNFSPLERASRESWRDVLQFLHTDLDGISEVEVEKRVKEYGFNMLEEPENEPLWKKFLEQFTEPLILLLLGSAVVSLLLGQIDDAIGILAALLIVSTVAFVQELKSEQMVEALKKLAHHMCVVVRAGVVSEISADALVPGDIVLLEPGKRIPADLRIVESNGLLVDESMLTGESEPVSKHNKPMETDADPLHRANCLYMGSVVCAGKAKCVVVCIGGETELGKISKMIHEAEEPRTPLQQQMDLLGRQLSVMSMIIVFVICLIGMAQGRNLLKMFTIGVSLAVAAIPEGLPIVVTVTLALGVSRMANKRAIVRKLPAVEALGAASVICSDKTGTLTRNEMTVTRVYAAGVTLNVTGHGYEPTGEFILQGEKFNPLSHPTFKKLLEVGITCNDSVITRADGIIGQPTEGAILCCALKAGLVDNRASTTFTDHVMFSSETKWMAKRYIVSGGQEYSVKGAPDVIVDKCTYMADYRMQAFPMTTAARQEIMDNVKELATQGLRVIGLAYGQSTQDLTFLGLVGIIDPPRDGVYDAIRRARIGGIKVSMLTGDSEDTAKAIGKMLHIFDETEGHIAMSGREVGNSSEQELSNVVDRVTVFYRVTPQDKMKIVKAFRSIGHVVAVTGDGVNDAPALKTADIGIAMGKSGTDVCKEASEMILVDDNFVTIISAIEEGKAIFDNTRNFLRFQLTTSIAALAIIALSTLYDFHIPFNGKKKKMKEKDTETHKLASLTLYFSQILVTFLG
eukprot:TRINITY_DN1202_c0_g2_i3.p1 TRINITY_DN1202_c0_g2~~TRINITY_DN1202_c0_g2_i3.p1  ORF type:complete len:748 (-),score=136.24 TRINITY_DN1202_c0_g2_i3:935-3178(-)